MYSVLLVDDDPIVCEGMKRLIDWEKYGFSVAGVANDGETAWKLQRKLCCDLIVTDIKMPNMDGLQLLEKLYTAGEKCKVIVISAYGEFEYAQAAMKYGVQYYMLKPVDEDILCGYLSRIANDLENVENSKNRAEITADFRIRLSLNGVSAEIQRYIHEHFSETLTLNSLAELYGFSPVYLGRLIKKELGTSFNEYLMQCRIQAAKEYIQSGDYSISTVSDLVGYKDVNYFFKCFKSITGMTPGEYKGSVK